MTDFAAENGRLLAEARERGNSILGATPVPPGMDNITIYLGLISSALELGKLMQTEGRDLEVIRAHHVLESQRLEAAFREVELSILTDFEREAALRDQTFVVISSLVASGQSEVALKFYEIFIDGFKRGAFEKLIELRNNAVGSRDSRIKLK